MNPPRSKRDYLRQLVEGKNRSFPPLADEDRAKGFLGWHQRGYLPHCDYPGLVQLVTFRLADSMPASRSGEWEHLLAIEENKERRAKLEEYLDRGVGACHLRKPEVAQAMQDTLTHFHDARYELLSWVVMPNHVHLLVQVWEIPLSKLVQSWKSYVAGKSNQILGRAGQFWETEYWHTYMRDEEQQRRAVRYIESNPVKTKLCHFATGWRFSSAPIRDSKTNRLRVPVMGAQSSGSTL